MLSYLTYPNYKRNAVNFINSGKDLEIVVNNPKNSPVFSNIYLSTKDFLNCKLEISIV